MQPDLDGNIATVYPSDKLTETVQRYIDRNHSVGALYRSLGYSRHIEKQAGLFISKIEALFPQDRTTLPSDENALNTYLKGLEDLFHAPHAPQPDEDKQHVRECISRLRRELNDRYIYPSTVQALRTSIDAVCTTFIHDDLRSERKQQLDALLWTLTSCRLDDGLDSVHSKNAVYEQTRSYLDAIWMHTPELSSRLLTDLLDTELAPLTREIADPINPSIWTSYLPQPWGAVVPSLLSFAFFAGGCVGLYYLLPARHFVSAGLLAAYLGLHYSLRYRHQKARLQGRNKLGQIAAKLKITRDEIGTGNFDAHEIELRLRRFETEGMYVHSLVYPLLCVASTRKASAAE